MEEKLKAMSEALWPYLKAKIDEEYKTEFKPRKRAETGRPKVYIPEIDWLILNYKLRGEARPAKFDQHGRVAMLKADPNRRYYCSTASGQRFGQYENNVYIPTQSLNQLDTLYGLIARTDFRVLPAVTYYMGGIINHKGERMNGSCSVYTLALHQPITREIVEATRRDWEHMTEDQRSKRLVSYPVMMEVLDILEQGQITPEVQQEMWRLLEDNAGNRYDIRTADELDHDDGRRLTAKRIAPTWMQDELPES